MNGIHALGMAVIGQAIDDFLATPRGRSWYEALEAQVDAGEFLLERTDHLTQLWFQAADLSLVRWRSLVPGSWVARLQEARHVLARASEARSRPAGPVE